MEVDSGKKKPIYSKSINTKGPLVEQGVDESIIRSEWAILNREHTYDINRMSSIKRACPFDVVKLARENSRHIFLSGIIGSFFGITGIHYFMLKDIPRGIIRLGCMLLFVLSAYLAYMEIGTGFAWILLYLSGFMLLGLLLFGLEEGIFLCNIATYSQRKAIRDKAGSILQIRIGRFTIDSIIKILIVILFVGIMGYLYWYSMIRK